MDWSSCVYYVVVYAMRHIHISTEDEEIANASVVYTGKTTTKAADAVSTGEAGSIPAIGAKLGVRVLQDVFTDISRRTLFYLII